MGVYFRNSNAMSPVIRHTGTDTSTLSYITIGGKLEMYFMFKGTAREIIRQYHNIIGKPALPPLYALGFYSGSHGYIEFEDDYTNLVQYIEQEIPLDGIWLNHKYMNNYKDFTVDQANFRELITVSSNILTQFGIETIL